MTESKKSQADWERIEADYRAGLLSVREIAASQGISHTAINKRAKTEGWERDLSARIQAKADALVSKREVSKSVSMETKVSERIIVEANAQAIADIRVGHRTDIGRARALVLSLLAELESVTGHSELFEELGDIMRSEDDKGQDKRNDIYRKVIASAGRVDSMKKLAEALNIVISLERKAWGIAEGAGERDEAAENLASRMEAARKRANGHA
nr:hypothetical protein [Herbaspirillum sp. ASV7]